MLNYCIFVPTCTDVSGDVWVVAVLFLICWGRVCCRLTVCSQARDLPTASQELLSL